MAVATLSVFAVPMTREFDWSLVQFSGAVSLGGLCAAAISPFLGRLIDRYGSGVILATTSLAVGGIAVGLSLVGQALAFYALYVPGRMAFASPLELGTNTAVNNWFIRRRSLALALLTVCQGTGLAAMPLVAQFIISGWNWRVAWVSLGCYTLAVGVLPALLLMARRPEDMGLAADPRPGESRTLISPPVQAQLTDSAADNGSREEPTNTDIGRAPEMSEVVESSFDAPTWTPATVVDPDFTVARALRTRAFWVLAVFSGAGFMVQAGVSLHQVSHFINQGLDGSAAAFSAGTFAFCQVLGGLLWSGLTTKVPIRVLLALSALCLSIGAAGIEASSNLTWGLPAAAILGVGVGGLHLLLRLAWAEYYGREHLGSITGLTLPVQVGGQALGPVIAGFMYDATQSYQLPFRIFAVAVFFAGLLVLTATPPKPQE